MLPLYPKFGFSRDAEMGLKERQDDNMRDIKQYLSTRTFEPLLAPEQYKREKARQDFRDAMPNTTMQTTGAALDTQQQKPQTHSSLNPWTRK